MALLYTSVDKMLGTFPRISEVSAITSAQLHDHAAAAEALVNGWVAQRYTVPVSGNPPLLATLATDLALYRVLALRMFTGEQLNESSWPDRYRDSMRMLEMVAAGDLPITTDSGTLVDPSDTGAASEFGTAWSSTMGYLPTFADGLPWGTEGVDPEKARDRLAERGTTLDYYLVR